MTPLRLVYIDIYEKWYLGHFKSGQNAFGSDVNGFDRKESAIQFITDHHSGTHFIVPDMSEIINKLVVQKNSGNHTAMMEEYKDRGFNSDVYNRGRKQADEAVKILHCLGYDEHGVCQF